jgi:hypothetical protein
MVQPQSSPSPAAGRPTIFDITVNQSNHHIQHKRKKKEKKYRMNKKETWFTKERGGWNLIFFKAPDSSSSRPACPVWWSVYIVPLIFIIPPSFPSLFLLFERGSSSWPTKITNGHATFSYVQQPARAVCVYSVGGRAGRPTIMYRTLPHHLQSSLTWYRAVANEIN